MVTVFEAFNVVLMNVRKSVFFVIFIASHMHFAQSTSKGMESIFFTKILILNQFGYFSF